MFNKIILVGNLTRDVEFKCSKTGLKVSKTAIATSRKFTVNNMKKEEVCFVDIVFFGRSAEIVNQYLRKGSKILVEGRLNLEKWVDKNGQKKSKHSVIVESMSMLDSRGHTQFEPQGDQSLLKQQSLSSLSQELIDQTQNHDNIHIDDIDKNEIQF